MTNPSLRFPVHGAAQTTLEKRDLRRVEQFAQRLIDELQTAIGRVRQPGQSTLALARGLGVHRNVCQRIVAALDARVSPLHTLVRLPGPEGVRLFGRAVARHAGTSVSRSPLMLIAAQYDGLIEELAGSQTKFFRRIEASMGQGQTGGTPGRNDLNDVRLRRQMRRSAADLLGSQMDVFTLVQFLRPIPDSPQLIEGIQTHGLIGFRTLGNPLVTVGRWTIDRIQVGDVAHEVRSVPIVGDSGLLEEFCSTPMPRGVLDDSEGVSRVMVDLSGVSPAPVDLVMARRWSPGGHPLHESTRSWTQAAKIGRPTARLLMDVYLHRSMAAMCVPSAAAFQWVPDLDPVRNHHDRLPGRLTVEILGPGTASAASEAWDRQRQLTESVFELGGWNPAEFVGYRCDVPEPMWGVTYYMIFDFKSSVEHGATE